MTEEQRARETAGHEADEALERAQQILGRSAKIAEGWRKSRLDNNFRQMLRRLGQSNA